MSDRQREAAVRGFKGRIQTIRRLLSRDRANKHIRIDAVAHREGGIFFINDDGEGALCAVVELAGISRGGLSPQNLLYNQERIAKILGTMAKDWPELSIHAWQDSSPVHLAARPDDWRNPFLAEVEKERNERLAREVTWEVKNYIAFELRGHFAYGGDTTTIDAVKAGGLAVKAKIQKRARDFEKNFYIFRSLWSRSSRRKRIFMSELRETVLSFDRMVDRVVSELVSPIGGIGAFRDMGSLVYQTGAEDKVLVRAKRLDAMAGYKAIYSLGDPSPERRRTAKLIGQFNLGAKLGVETVDFDYLYRLVTGQEHNVLDANLRALGEYGPYTVGGVPRQVFAVREIPERGLRQDVFASLRRLGVPYTARIRWAGLTEQGTKSELERLKTEKRWREGGDGFVHAEVVADRVMEGIAMGQGVLGNGSILISVNGVPHKDARGRQLTGADVLLDGVNKLRSWASANDLLVDPLFNDQELGHYAMYPGSTFMDPIERIPLRAWTLGKLLPLFSTSPEVPASTIAPAILTYRDHSGQIIDRCLEVGQVGLAAVCGGTGSGKSYGLVDIILNFTKLEGRLSEEAQKFSIDCFEFGSGQDEGSSFNSVVRLLGGKVISFGENAVTRDVINPFDLVLPRGATYGPDTVEALTDLVVTMAGGEYDAHTGGGTVTPQVKMDYKDTIIKMGGLEINQIPGQVRSVTNLYGMLPGGEAKRLLAEWADPKQKGRYFPSAHDETGHQVVNYNFNINMPADIRSVLFAAVTTRLANRVFSPDVQSKLLIGDEVGQGLARGKNAREEAVVESARILLQKVFTNARRFGGRAVLAFQNPKQIIDMGPTLKSVIKSQASGYWLYPMAMKEEAMDLFNLSEGIFEEIRQMPRRNFALIQGGMLTVAGIDNQPGGLAHAAATTDPAETGLRDAMVASGKFGTGRSVDRLGLLREFCEQLKKVAHLKDEPRTLELRNLAAQYRRNAA